MGSPSLPTPAGTTVLCFGKSKKWEMFRSGTESVNMTLAENVGGVNFRDGFATQMLNYPRHTVKLKFEFPHLCAKWLDWMAFMVLRFL